jgi:hypothetical protein
MSSLSWDTSHIIRGDDLFATTLLRSVDHVEKISLLWKILGIEHPDHLYACPSRVDSIYTDETMSVAVTLWDQTYQCSQSVADAFGYLLDSEIQVVDFFFILYAGLKDLSPSYKKYLTRKKISVKQDA